MLREKTLSDIDKNPCGKCRVAKLPSCKCGPASGGSGDEGESDTDKKVENNSNSLPVWQQRLVEQIFNAMKSYYCFPEKLQEDVFKTFLTKSLIKINSTLVDKDKKQFSEQVSKVLQEFDEHLCLTYDPSFIAKEIENKNIVIDKKSHSAKFLSRIPGEKIILSMHKTITEDNYGFVEKVTDRAPLHRDIGYVKIKYFIGPFLDEDPDKSLIWQEAKKKAYDVMRKMRGKKAIIIDLRDSTGGSPEMVEYLISFFFKEIGMKINEVHDRTRDKVTEYKVQPHDFTLFNQPVYILTNAKTFSAAEEFAYDLQQINQHALQDSRFRVVGEVTRGGAHPYYSFPLVDTLTDEINQEYLLWVSTSYAKNPYSQGNWEDNQTVKGVKPDRQIKPGEDALDIVEKQIKSAMAIARNRLFQARYAEQHDASVDVHAARMAYSAFGTKR